MKPIDTDLLRLFEADNSYEADLGTNDDYSSGACLIS